MPLQKTPQRPRTSSLKLSRAKVRVRFNRCLAFFPDDGGQTAPVLLSPFSDCKTPNSPAHPVCVSALRHLGVHLSLAGLQVPKPCSCNITRKRRCPPADSRSSRRPRRQDCPLGNSPHGSGVFDRLPWVSILDAPTPQQNPWDIADLSQLPIDEPSLPLGPIRRRKTSLRSVPFPLTPSSSPASYSPVSFPSLEYASRDPRTPPRETEPPSAIRFQGLLPAPV